MIRDYFQSNTDMRKRNKSGGVLDTIEEGCCLIDNEDSMRNLAASATAEQNKEFDCERKSIASSWPSPARFAQVLIIITVIAASSRYFRIDEPNETVFDEVHFGGFALNYVRGEYYFDIHPPLGKMILAGAGWLIGMDNYNATIFKSIGNKYPDDNYIYIRIVPAFFGTLMVPLTLLICKELGRSFPAALLATGFVLLEGIMLVTQRLILTDSSLWFFGALSIYCNLRFWNLEDADDSKHISLFTSSKWWLWMFATGLSMGAVCSVKWTGTGVVAALGAVQIARTVFPFLFIMREKIMRSSPHNAKGKGKGKWSGNGNGHSNNGNSNSNNQMMMKGKQQQQQALSDYSFSSAMIATPFGLNYPLSSPMTMRFYRRRFVSGLVAGVIMLSVAAALYYAVWIAHFAVLTNHGPGAQWHNVRFRYSLEGSDGKLQPGEEPYTTWEKIIEIHQLMYRANSGLKGDHAYGSSWYQWPWMDKGMSYWSKHNPDKMSYQQIFLGGNIIVFSITTLSVIFYLGYILSCVNQDIPYSKRQIFYGLSSLWLLLGYFLNWLPYMKITRVCFIYHYVPSLYFGVLMAAMMLDKFVRNTVDKALIVGILLSMSAIYFALHQYNTTFVKMLPGM